MKRLSSFLAISMLLLSSTAMAKISPLAFKGVTKNFRKGKELYSPVLGEAALDSLVSNIRFNGPFTPAYKENGERFYSQDKSNVPLWNLVNILFPSTNGLLGVETAAKSNFGARVNDPKVVAMLLNFAYQTRNEIEEHGAIESSKRKLSAAQVRSILNLSGAKDKPAIKTIESLFDMIEKSIQAENQPGSLYPRGTTEQMITAFFCYKFDTQDDIWKLMAEMDDEIVDKEALKAPHTLISKEDIEELESKEEDFDLDDVYDLTQAEIFESSAPYKLGVPLLNNGLAEFYSRTKNKLEKNKILSDCVETVTAKHTLNFILYDRTTLSFDVSHIILPETDEPEKNPTHQLVKLIQNQKLEHVNAGNRAIRSAINSIVADLNSIPGGDYIVYRQGDNELKSGYINMVHVLSKILNVPLSDQSPEGDLDAKAQWVTKSLVSIFSSVNPNHTYAIQYSPKSSEDDLIGNLTVKVKDLDLNELFSFNIHVQKGHSEISDFKSFEDLTNHEEILKKHTTKIQKGTAEESLWVLTSNPHQQVTQPLYQLFTHRLEDNEGRIDFIKNLGKLTVEEVGNSLDQLKQMLGNVLSHVLWHDDEIIKRISAPIYQLLEKNVFNDVLKKEVTAISVSKEVPLEKIAPYFKNVSRLIVPEGETLDFSTLESPWVSLKIFHIHGNRSLKSIKGFFNTPNLNSMHITGATVLEKIKLDAELPSLEWITVKSSAIKKIEGLNYAKNLELLDLADSKQFNELLLPIEMPKLRRINLSYSGVSSIKNLKNATNLKELILQKTEKLTGNFEFTDTMKFLTGVSFKESGVTSLSGIENLPALKALYLPEDHEVTIKIKNKAFTPTFKITGKYKYEYEEDV